MNKSTVYEERIYLIALVIAVFGAVLRTTMFQKPWQIMILCDNIPWILVIAKMSFYNRKDIKYLLISVVLLIFSQIIYINTGYFEPLYVTVMIVGAKNVSFNKILKVHMCIAFTMVVIAFFASILGVIENLQYVTKDRGVRNSFGIVYPTDFAAHIFFIMLSYAYIRKEKLKLWNYILGLFIAIGVYAFCKARIDVVCMILLIVGYGILNVVDRYSVIISKKILKCLHIISAISMPFAAIIMYSLTMLYQKNVGFWNRFPDTLVSRFRQGQEGILQYGITPFGQYIRMVGAGGTTVWPDDYFFLDCSYINCVLRYGAVFLIVILMIYVLSCWKQRGDSYLLWAVVLIALNCIIAHHLVELAYNPFNLMLFADGMNESGFIVRRRR